MHIQIQEENQQKLSAQQFLDQTTEVCSVIANVIKSKSELDLDNSDYDKHELTVVPFYNTQLDSQDELIKRINPIMGLNGFIPQLTNQSSVLTQDCLVQIVAHVPSIFKTTHWKIIYSNTVHGSSFQTLLNQTEHHSPLILAIKDLTGCVFGGYLNDFPRFSIGKFYGTGETFVWRCKNSVIDVYAWSQANQDFIHCDTDGLAIGCGDKFGIYISQNLITGYTTQCETFKNEVLNETGEFNIQQIEIWGLNDQ